MSPGGSGKTARKRLSGWLIFSSVLLAIIGIAAALVFVPQCLVSTWTMPAEKLQTLKADELGQLVATTRQSVGLVCAAVVAACVAAIGVFVSQRNVNAVLDGQAQASSQHSEDVRLERDRLKAVLDGQSQASTQHSQDIRLERERLEYNRTADLERNRADRFKSAVEFLGDQQSAVRLAGIYALVSLADEVEELRSTCVEILCAYLRRADAPKGDKVVRLVIFDQIGQHLNEAVSAETSWSSMSLDLDGVTLPPLSWKNSTIRSISLRNALVNEKLVLTNVRIIEGLDARGLRIPGNSSVLLDTRGEGTINVKDANVSGALTISHSPQKHSSRGPRHIILSDGVRVAEQGEYRIIVRAGYSRQQIRATDIRLQQGSLRIEVEDDLIVDGTPISLSNLRGARQNGFEIDRRLHDKVTGRSLDPLTDECVVLGANLDDAEACLMVRCRCDSRAFAQDA